MSQDVKIRITTEAELRAAEQARQNLEGLVQTTNKADKAAADYKKTLDALNQAITQNVVVKAKEAAQLSETIKLAEKLGVNTATLKQRYNELNKEIGTEKPSMFKEMQTDVGHLMQSIPGLGRVTEAAMKAAAGPVGALTLAFGELIAAGKKFAEQEVFWAKFDTALSNSGHLMDGTREKYFHLMRAMTDKTPQTTDEQWGKIIMRLTQFGRSASDIPKDIETIRNLSGVVGSVERATYAYIQAMNGQYFMLRRLGIVVPQTASQFEKMNILQREAARIGGGQLAAVQSTLIGQWDSMSTNLGRLTEAIGTQIGQGLQPLKFVYAAIGDTAKRLAENIERIIPPMKGLRDQVTGVTDSMSEEREKMEDYRRSWTAIHSAIEASRGALSNYSKEIDHNFSKQKELAKFNQEQAIAQIQNNPNIAPEEKAARIAQVKAQGAGAQAAAQLKLDDTQIALKTQGVLSAQSSTRAAAENLINVQGLVRSGQAGPVDLQLAQQHYAQVAGDNAKQISKLEQEIQELRNQRNLDKVTGQKEVIEAQQQADKERLQKTGEAAKTENQSGRFSPLLSNTFTGDKRTAGFWNQVNRQQGAASGQFDAALQGSSIEQLQQFIQVADSAGWHMASAKAKRQMLTLQVSNANIDAYLARAMGDTDKVGAFLVQRDKLVSDALKAYSDSLEQYRSGKGTQGYPISPFAIPNLHGVIPRYPAPIPGATGGLAVPSTLTAASTAFRTSGSGVPTLSAPAPLPVVSQDSGAFVPAVGWVPTPGFNPSTMVPMMDSRSGEVYVFMRNPDGTPDYGRPVLASSLGTGHPKTVMAGGGLTPSGVPTLASGGANLPASYTGYQPQPEAIPGVQGQMQEWRQRNPVFNDAITVGAGALLLGGASLARRGVSGALRRGLGAAGSAWRGGAAGGPVMSAPGPFQTSPGGGMIPGSREHMEGLWAEARNPARSSEQQLHSLDQYESFKNNFDRAIGHGEKLTAQAEQEHLSMLRYNEQARMRGLFPISAEKVEAARAKAANMRAALAEMKGERTATLLDVKNNPHGFDTQVPGAPLDDITAGKSPALATGGKYAGSSENFNPTLRQRLPTLASKAGIGSKAWGELGLFGKFGRGLGMAGGAISLGYDAGALGTNAGAGNYGAAGYNAFNVGLDAALINPATMVPAGAIKGAESIGELGFAMHGASKAENQYAASEKSLGQAGGYRAIKARIYAIINKGAEATPEERAWALGAIHHFQNPGSTPLPAPPQASAAPERLHVDLGKDTAEGRSERFSKQFAGMASDFASGNIKSTKDLGDESKQLLQGIWTVMNPKAKKGPSGADLINLISGGTSQSDVYQNLYQYYHKQGYPAAGGTLGPSTPQAQATVALPKMDANVQVILQQSHTVSAILDKLAEGMSEEAKRLAQTNSRVDDTLDYIKKHRGDNTNS